MVSSIIDKSCKVLIIDPRVDARGAMREAVKATGFVNTMVVASIKEAWEVFATEEIPPQWVVSSLLADEPQNAFRLLALFLQEPRFQHCRLSLMVQEEEKYCLPNAFEMGLLSWHIKPFTQATLAVEFTSLIESLKNDPTHGCLTSAEYLRSYLTASDSFEALIKLEESLIVLQPGNENLFLSLAEAQQLAGDSEAARRTIHQAKYLGTRIAKGAKQLLDLVEKAPEGSVDNTNMTFAQAFDVKNAIIIDPDTTSSGAAKSALNEIGIQDIQVFTDGKSAWDWIEQNPEPGLVIHEWRIPQLTGPAFIQRWRSKGYTKAPIIVLSSLVKGHDQNLLRELGAAALIEKPVERDKFIASIMSVIRQQRFPTSIKAIQRKILLALESNNLTEANSLHEKLKVLAPAGQEGDSLVEAAFAFQRRDFSTARKQAFEALKQAGDSLIILNLLGKIFLKIRAFEESLKCFNKIQELSSQNLERLCMIAEAQTELGDISEAKKTIENAKNVDANSEVVKITESKIAITDGNTDKAAKIMGTLDSLQDIVAYTNNRAVSLAKSGDLKGSQDLYEKALASLPKSESKFRPMILYNIGLSHAKEQKLDLAAQRLTEVAAFGDSPTQQKALSLKKRVDQAVATGKVLDIKVSTDPVDEITITEHRQELQIMALNAKPGQIGVHQVFHCPKGLDPKVITLLKNNQSASTTMPAKRRA